MECSSFSKQHDVCFVTVIIFVQSRAFIVKMAGHSTGTEECGMLSKISTGISAKILQLCYITCLTGVLSSVFCLHLMRSFFCCCCRFFRHQIFYVSLPFYTLTLLLGLQEGHPTSKKLGVGLLVMIWLELCTSLSGSCHRHRHHP